MEFLYLVGCFEQWYVTVHTHFALNFLPVSVLVLEENPAQQGEQSDANLSKCCVGRCFTLPDSPLFTSQFFTSPDFSCCFVDGVSDLGGQLGDGVKQQTVQHGLSNTNRSSYFQRICVRSHSSSSLLQVRSAGPTSSRFQVRLLSARGSRLSGARGRSSTGLPLTSGVLLVEMTGGIFLKLRLSSKTRSTSWG